LARTADVTDGRFFFEVGAMTKRNPKAGPSLGSWKYLVAAYRAKEKGLTAPRPAPARCAALRARIWPEGER
jgi:hypothetical protein